MPSKLCIQVRPPASRQRAVKSPRNRSARPRARTFPANSRPIARQRFQALHEIFEAQADLCPEAVAVLCDGQQTTYGHLEQQANRLARHLRARGIRRGSIVALLMWFIRTCLRTLVAV